MSPSPPQRTIAPESFRSLFVDEERERISTIFSSVIERWAETTNTNYFAAPQSYDPYERFLGNTHEGLELLPDLSRPNMSSLYFLSQLEGEHVVLDYACGVSGFLHCAQRFAPTFGFDRWVQVPREACSEFLDATGTPSDRLVDLDEIPSLAPTILNVAGYWIEDLDLYALPSVQYVLSDTLYNSGSVEGEGVHYYLNDWNGTPDHCGFRLQDRYPALDVFVRSS